MTARRLLFRLFQTPRRNRTQSKNFRHRPKRQSSWKSSNRVQPFSWPMQSCYQASPCQTHSYWVSLLLQELTRLRSVSTVAPWDPNSTNFFTANWKGRTTGHAGPFSSGLQTLTTVANRLDFSRLRTAVCGFFGKHLQTKCRRNNSAIAFCELIVRAMRIWSGCANRRHRPNRSQLRTEAGRGSTQRA